MVTIGNPCSTRWCLRGPSYRKTIQPGLQITEVRPGSPAELQGFQLGDTLLGLDLYEVINLSNLDYVLQKADARGYDELRFRILRGRRVRSGIVNLEDEAI